MEKDWNNIKTVLGIRLYRENERNNYFLINFLDKHQNYYSIIKINNDYFILIEFVIVFEDYFNKFFKNTNWVNRFYELSYKDKEIIKKLHYHELFKYSDTVTNYFTVEVSKKHMRLKFSPKYPDNFLREKSIDFSKITPDMYNLCTDIILNGFYKYYQRGYIKRFNLKLHEFITENL